MTYTETLLKLRKIKTRKVVIPKELRERDEAEAEKKKAAEKAEVKAGG